MQYKDDVTIPANTLATAPTETFITVNYGVVDQVSIEFPAGCKGLVGARIFYHEFQLWPLTSGEWFVTDDFTIVFPEHHLLNEKPYELKVQTYNTDETHGHTLSFRFSLSPPHADPLKQIAEIMARRELEEAPFSFKQAASIEEYMRNTYALLYSIHSQDFPMLIAYIDSLRR